MTDSLLTELMTADQVAELLQMRRSTVEDYARRGLLPSIKLGRHRRFVRSPKARPRPAVERLAASPAHAAENPRQCRRLRDQGTDRPT